LTLGSVNVKDKTTSACRIEINETLEQMDGTGSGSCPIVGFDISGVKTSGSATGDLVN